MKLHRFYAGELHDKRGPLQLNTHVWVQDEHLLNQWLRVLRYREGDELELFDGLGDDRLYRISKIEPLSVGLELITQLEPKLPTRHIYLFWALLKKDNNDLVLQKCTELGVTNFVPLLTERTEKTGFDEDRSQRIVIEASEQCGRSDIPHVREPIGLAEALDEYSNKAELLVCEQSADSDLEFSASDSKNPVGILIGPEGGWSESEKQLFTKHNTKHLNLHNLTLRAETAAISAVTRLLQ